MIRRALVGRRAAAVVSVFVAAAAVRLQYVNITPVYPDEGMVIELASRIASGQEAAIGALKQGAFAPLATSPLAPWTISVVITLTDLDPLVAVRVWSALLAGLTAGGLVWALWNTAPAPLFGFLAGLVFALCPLAIALGRWGFYHHLSALAIVVVMGLALRDGAQPDSRRFVVMSFVCSLAVIAAYWALWLLLVPLFVAALTGRAGRVRLLAAAGAALLLPLVALFAWAWLTQGSEFWGDARELWSQGRLADQRSLLWGTLRGFGRAAASNPWLYFAVVGLPLWWAADRASNGRRAATLVMIIAFLSAAEPMRQRQNMDVFPYPLILVLPMASVGLAAFAVSPLHLKRAWSPILAAVGGLGAAVVLAQPVPLRLMHRLAAPVADARQLFSELERRLEPGSIVLGTAAINWGAWSQGFRASDLEQAAAYLGERTFFLRPDIDRHAFLFAPTLADAAALIVSDVDYLYTFQQKPPRRLVMIAEREKWPLLWSNASFRVYGNPRHGHAEAAFPERILRDPMLYRLAAFDAFDRTEYQLASLACRQFLAVAVDDRASCEELLERVDRLRTDR